MAALAERHSDIAGVSQHTRVTGMEMEAQGMRIRNRALLPGDTEIAQMGHRGQQWAGLARGQEHREPCRKAQWHHRG